MLHLGQLVPKGSFQSVTGRSVKCRSTRETSDDTSTAVMLHASDAPAAWGSLHENAMYLEERRTTRSTRGSHGSLVDELPDDFQVVDTAPGIFRQLPEDHAGRDFRSMPIV